jgi:hypothetical protein
MSSKINCNICCEDVNVKSALTCASCNTTYCIKCSKTYLLSVFEAHCMGCKKQWDERFIRDSFPKTWVNGEYKQHIKKMLLEREKSFIPATMESVNRVVENLRRERNSSERRIASMKLSCKILSIESRIKQLKGRDLIKNESEIDRLTKTMKDLKAKFNNIPETTIDELELEFKSASLVEEKINKKCPLEDCKGYLKRNVCMVCEKHICGECNLEKDDDHECKKEDVETYKLISKESKPCPKCATRITFGGGCSQMFCVSCKTVWDWKTEKIQEKGVIHNPEYFRYMRDRGIPLPRQEDVIRNRQVGCLDMNQLFRSNMKYNLVITNDFTTKHDVEKINIDLFVHELYRFFHHMRHNRGDFTEFNYTDQSFKELRVEYILNNITEESFINTVIKQYKQKQYRAMIYNLQEIFITIIEDLFDKIHFSVSKTDQESSVIENELHKSLTSFFEFVSYYNKQNCEIMSLFGYRTCHTLFFMEKERERFYMRIDNKNT